MTEDTVFMKIIRREIPADIVYEDASTIAFLDIRPNNPGHTLVVPKTFARNIFDIRDETLDAVMHTVRLIAPAVRNAVSADGMTIIMNNEPASGQIVFHAHVHLIPRFSNDGFGHLPQKQYVPGEAASIAEKIRQALA